MNLEINMPAILVTVVACFILGFIWYTPLFGKAWGKEMGYDPNEKPATSTFVRGLVFMVIGNFLFAWVLAHNIAAWGFVPGIGEMSTFGSAMSTAVFTWMGFYLPGELGATVWEKKSWKLFAINTGYHLATLILAAFILTYWQ